MMRIMNEDKLSKIKEAKRDFGGNVSVIFIDTFFYVSSYADKNHLKFFVSEF